MYQCSVSLWSPRLGSSHRVLLSLSLLSRLYSPTSFDACPSSLQNLIDFYVLRRVYATSFCSWAGRLVNLSVVQLIRHLKDLKHSLVIRFFRSLLNFAGLADEFWANQECGWGVVTRNSSNMPRLSKRNPSNPQRVYLMKSDLTERDFKLGHFQFPTWNFKFWYWVEPPLSTIWVPLKLIKLSEMEKGRSQLYP